jgi:hypothetical protein
MTDVKPWVTMKHPDIEVPGMASREAFDMLYADKGWQIADEHDAPPALPGEEVEAERLVVDGVVTDQLADPQRLSKVQAGEVAAADVGVDPAHEPQAEPEAESLLPPPPPAAFVEKIEGETYAQYVDRAHAAGQGVATEESWNAVTAVPAGQGA